MGELMKANVFIWGVGQPAGPSMTPVSAARKRDATKPEEQILPKSGPNYPNDLAP